MDDRITLTKYLSVIQNFDKTEEYFNIYKEACRIDVETLWWKHKQHEAKESGVMTEEAEGIIQKAVKTLKEWWEKVVHWFFGLFKFLPRFIQKFFTMFSTLSSKFRDYKSKSGALLNKIKSKYSGEDGVSTAWEAWMVDSNSKYGRSNGAFNFKATLETSKSIKLSGEYIYKKEKEFDRASDGDMVLKLASRCAENIVKLQYQGVTLFPEGAEVPHTGIQDHLTGKLKSEYTGGRNKGNSLLAILYNTEKLIDVPVTVKMPAALVDLPKDFAKLSDCMDGFFRETDAMKKRSSRKDRIEDLRLYKWLKEYREKVLGTNEDKEYDFTKASFSQDEKELKRGIEVLEEVKEKIKKMDEESELESGHSTTQTMLDSLNTMAKIQALFLDNISTLYQLVLDSLDLRFKIIESFESFLGNK